MIADHNGQIAHMGNGLIPINLPFMTLITKKEWDASEVTLNSNIQESSASDYLVLKIINFSP